MLFLIQNISSHAFDLRRAYRQTQIPRLPFKFFHFDDIVNPTRRAAFDISQNIIQSMYGAQADEQMDVIFNAADCDGNAVEPANDAAEICVKI